MHLGLPSNHLVPPTELRGSWLACIVLHGILILSPASRRKDLIEGPVCLPRLLNSFLDIITEQECCDEDRGCAQVPEVRVDLWLYHELSLHIASGNSFFKEGDSLGETFAKNSSTDNYTEEFKKFKSVKEKSPINFTSQNIESYNKPLTVEELEVVLGKSKDSTTGPDEIHYQLLKHLPSSCKGTLIELFNNMWEKGSFPPSWREATVIPIPKQGKDNTIPNTYISHTPAL